MKVADNQRSFEEKGKGVFYLADTCWSAFTNIREDDWDYYLRTRKNQGFNVIQVNMLWQWDASETDLDFLPFAKDKEGNFKFEQFNEAYFDRAERMIAKARDYDMTIALVLLWCNYLPNTWASDLGIRQVGIFPKELVESYVSKVVTRYNRYQPIYVISGDTDFQTDEVIHDYYGKALDTVKKLAPEALTTLHIRGREADIPAALKENPQLDFYMFQSGHNHQFPQMTYELAETFYKMEPPKPALNSEPCYEMMGYARRAYGRFSREDVRKAAWQSVLSGAFAGVTYGAHGIWSWHDERLSFDSSVGEAFETPYDWHQALAFQGALDYGFIREFFEDYRLFDLEPCQDLIRNGLVELSEAEKELFGSKPVVPNVREEIRASENERYIILYIPSNIVLRLQGDFSSSKLTFVDLESRRQVAGSGQYHREKNETHIHMHPFTRDALLLIEK